jgi:hypothetical protein
MMICSKNWMLWRFESLDLLLGVLLGLVDALGVFKTDMDDYVALASDVLVPEYTLIATTESGLMIVPNTIVVDPGILVDCPGRHELKDNMEKRLVGTSKLTGGPNLCVVAMMCLASRDYSVSHVSLCDVTERYMLKVWSYLERQVVSSSYQLRQWMRSHIGTRTCEGYMAHWNISRSLGPSVGNLIVKRGSWSKCVDVTKDMANKISGQPTTILESAYNDIAVSSKIKVLFHS